MSSIEEQRKQKQKISDPESGSTDTPSIDEAISTLVSSHPEQEDAKTKAFIKSYSSQFTKTRKRTGVKQGVFIDAGILQLIRKTIFHLELNVPMGIFIENVLREHFASYGSQINDAVSKKYEPNIIPDEE